MTPDEIKTLLADLSQRQRIDTIDQIAFADTMADHDAPTVFRALAAIRRTQPYVNPHDLDQALNAGTTAHVDHVMHLLAEGRFNQALDPNEFPDQRSYEAARSVSPQLRSAYSGQARKIYLEAWQQRQPDGTRPALTVVRNPDEKAIGA